MNKILFFFLMIIGSSQIIADNSTYTIGISAGPNYSNLKYSKMLPIWQNIEYQNNYSTGLIFEYKPIQNISFLSGIRYSSLSNKVSIDLDYYSDVPEGFLLTKYFINKLKIINMPILMKYYIPFSGSNYILTGVEFGYISSYSIKSVYIDNSNTNDNYNNDINRYNASMLLGLGYEKDINSVKVFISIAYSHGINNLLTDDWAGKFYTREYYSLIGIIYTIK